MPASRDHSWERNKNAPECIRHLLPDVFFLPHNLPLKWLEEMTLALHEGQERYISVTHFMATEILIPPLI